MPGRRTVGPSCLPPSTGEQGKKAVTQSPKRNLPAKPYEPTPDERTAIEAYFARKKQKLPSPYMKVPKKGRVAEISLDHPEPMTGQLLLMHALATTEVDFANGLLNQLADVSSKGGEVDEGRLNFLLSVIKSIAPRDEIETMLAAQMAAVHNATMTFARRLSHVETIAQRDSAERTLNKLARTFTTQIETLNRHRGKGQQKVTVEHVHVHQGGQAIVGNVEQSPESKHQGKTDAGVPNATTHGPRKSEPTQ